MIVWGIDPGKTTGIAVFRDGQLVTIDGITHVDLFRFFFAIRVSLPSTIIIEDSRKTKSVFAANSVNGSAPALKIARNVGMVDARCADIELLCDQLGIGFIGVSPKAKGKKLDAGQFKRITRWPHKTNQHGRDAAMVAWPYRSMRAEVRKAA